MVINNSPASGGLPASVTQGPQDGGVESLGLDPNNQNTIYIAYSGGYSSDVSYPALPGDIYKSTDGGVTFTAGDLNVAQNPNGNNKFDGERITVSPSNSSLVYYGSESNGLWVSTNGGAHWSQVSGNGAPATTTNVTRILFVGSTTYVVVNGGSVYKSTNGGSSWSNISSGQGIDGNCGNSTSDPSAIYVVQNGSTNIWKYNGSSWSSFVASLTYGRNPYMLAVDPSSSGQTMYCLGPDGDVAASYNGGSTWNDWNDYLSFNGTFGWLPQATGWRNCGGIYLDANKTLWIPQGNEGVLDYMPNGSETFNSPLWTINSLGIEEFVSHDVIVPPGGNPVFAVEDSTALYVTNPSQLTAKQANLQNQLISDGTGLAYCPNAPLYVVCATADVNYTSSQLTYSGYSTNGGQTWTNFTTEPEVGTPVAGSIAVSARNGWGLGNDHIVYLPSNDTPPYWSHDGGKTWTLSTGNFGQSQFYWNFSLKQRQLKADPFIADKFYLGATWYGGFFVSTDGGQTWQLQANAGLPSNCHHGQLEVNRAVKNDLWYCDGWQGGSAHGLWHSTNGGQTFTPVSGITNAIALTLGAGSGNAGDQPFTVYFYGLMSGNSSWGVFRSTDGGATWNQISHYPTGLVDQPTCMAASWDTYSQVYIGFEGNSFVYGTTGSAGGGGSLTGSVHTTQTPSTTSDNDGVAYELGLKFQSSQAGQITGLRFWKDANESGTHTGHLWSSSGSLLATATFTNETESGWQTVNLGSPVSITPNTTYVVSVNTGNNYFVDTPGGLASSIVNSPLDSVADGNDGVFGGVNTFPTSSYNNSDYFRDVVFSAGSGGGGSTLANGTYQLTPSYITGSSLDANGAGTANGTNVDIWANAGGSNQEWVFTNEGGNI
jgi:hypothetical protein